MKDFPRQPPKFKDFSRLCGPCLWVLRLGQTRQNSDQALGNFTWQVGKNKHWIMDQMTYQLTTAVHDFLTACRRLLGVVGGDKDPGQL